MRKAVLYLIVSSLFSASVFAQAKDNLQAIADTEKTFAEAAATKGIKPAFLEFFASEGFAFNPEPSNAKEFWTKHADTPALLTWYPAFIDVSSNGTLAYSTGPGEYRPKGKNDPTVYYSEYLTVWQKQADGSYKAVIDLGISRPNSSVPEAEWKPSQLTGEKSMTDVDLKKSSATVVTKQFFDAAENTDLTKAYKSFAAEDIRILREDSAPIIGKKAALERIKKDRGTIKFSKPMFSVSGGDLAYLTDAYTLTGSDKKVIKGSLVQVWKLRNGNWQLVMDVWNQYPPEK